MKINDNREDETRRKAIYSRHLYLMWLSLVWKEKKEKKIGKAAMRGNERFTGPVTGRMHVIVADVSYLWSEKPSFRYSGRRANESLAIKKKTYANRSKTGPENGIGSDTRVPRVYRYRKSRLCLSTIDRVCILTRETSSESFLDRSRFRSRWNRARFQFFERNLEYFLYLHEFQFDRHSVLR